MTYKTHALIQGSQLWHEFRADHFGASEAASMLGLSSQLSRNDLLLYKKTGKSKECSDYVQKNILDYGHEVEAKARAILENELNDELYPVTCSQDKLSASCDGLTIDGHIAFEHKQISKDIVNYINENGILPRSHMPQCQQILMITGAKKLIFVCSDGTESNRVMLDIHPDREWFEIIKSGWEQFAKDLETFEPKEFTDKQQAAAIMQLPALSVYTKGDIVVHGNLDAFKEASDKYIASINKDLKTDEDFVNAEAAIKRCKEVEQNIKTVKASIIGGIASVDEATRVLDYIDDSHAKIRLMLEKIVKSQKESIKTNIINNAYKLCVDHQSSIASEFKNISFAALVNLSRQSFETACKGLRTLSSLHNAVDTEVAAIKIKLDDLARAIRKNLAHLPDDLSLFRDLQAIITKPEDDFKLLVEYRLDDQKRKEAQKRKDIEIAEAKAKEEADAQQLEKSKALENAFSAAKIPATELTKQEIKSIEKTVVFSEFDKWWVKIGSYRFAESDALDESEELAVKAIARSAWDYAQSLLKQDSAA